LITVVDKHLDHWRIPTSLNSEYIGRRLDLDVELTVTLFFQAWKILTERLFRKQGTNKCLYQRYIDSSADKVLLSIESTFGTLYVMKTAF
jgi:hypothetical protein